MFSDDPLAVLDEHHHHTIPPTIDKLLATSEIYTWSGLITRVYRVHAAPDALPCMPANSNIITLHLENVLELACAQGKHRYAATSGPGGVCVFPYAEPLTCSWTRPACIMHIYLPNPGLARAAECLQPHGSEHVALRFRFNMPDLLIYQLGQVLLAELTSGGLGGRLYAETLGQALTMYLLRRHSSLVVTRAPAAHRLGRAELARALDYINEHLAQDITLAELAAAVHLSPSHFARVFRRTLGLAPHQYLIQQRLERARSLLVSGSLTISEIAQQVGFADHSHLTRHFKRRYGVAPKAICQRKNLLESDKNLQDTGGADS